MYSASITYRAENGTEKYITFVGLPGDGNEHNEYFAEQVCMNYGWEHISSRAEPNPRRHLTAEEKTEGVIRKPYEFFEKKGNLLIAR